MAKQDKVNLGDRVTQAQLAEYSTEIPNLERLEARIDALTGHFKEHRNEVDPGRFALHAVVGSGSSVKYAEAVKQLKVKHPELVTEIDDLVEANTKATAPIKIEVEDTEKGK